MGPVDKIRSDWLETRLGRRCLVAEQHLLRHALDRLFGEQFLQLGLWGDADTFLPFARTQRAAVVDWRPDGSPHFLSHMDRLAVAADSVDVMLLPHTLELIPSPHALLREVDRVLRADGYLVILSFRPGGAWGLRHWLSHDGYPPGHQRLIRERRLRDWLELLSFEVGERRHYCHTLPLEKLAGFGARRNENWVGRWIPGISGGYLLCAQKRVHPITPVRRPWRPRQLEVVGGLVEPSTRVPQRRGTS